MNASNNFNSHGYLTISNYGGYEIEINDAGDSARLSYFGKVSRWQEIKYTRSGRPFVRYYNRRLYLDEFSRHGFGMTFK